MVGLDISFKTSPTTPEGGLKDKMQTAHKVCGLFAFKILSFGEDLGEVMYYPLILGFDSLAKKKNIKPTVSNKMPITNGISSPV